MANELPNLYKGVIEGTTTLADHKRGSVEIMANRDVLPFEALREYALDVLCVTLDEPFLQKDASLLSEVSAYRVLQKVREELKDYGREQAETSWQGELKHHGSNIDVYNSYPQGASFSVDTKRPQRAAIRGMLLTRYPQMGLPQTIDYDLQTSLIQRAAVMAERMEKKFGQSLKEGRVAEMTTYLTSVRFLTLARKWTLWPIAARVNHLEEPGLVRHTDIATYLEYLEKVLPETMRRTEAAYFIASSLKIDVLAQEEHLFGDNASKKAELWKLVLFVRDMTPPEEWKLIEPLLDENIQRVVSMINEIVQADDKRLPFFIVERIQNNPKWLESFEDIQGVEFI